MPVISGVPTVITTPGVYKLTSDLIYSSASGAAITIKASGVTIDLNGFAIRNSISARDFSYQTAIGIRSDNVSNVTIKNGDISGFYFGVQLNDPSKTEFDRTGGHVVTNVDVTHVSFRGISVQGVNNRITDCDVSNIQGHLRIPNSFAVGIESYGPRGYIAGNTVREVYAQGRGEALGISFSHNGVGSIVTNNVVTNARVDEFRSFGIWVGGGSNVNATYNTITKYSYGFGWSSVTFGQFSNNTIIDNPKVYVNTSKRVVDHGTTIKFAPGRNTYDAHGGNDTLIGNSGIDTLDGGDGNDHIYGRGARDFLDGGKGYDFARYDDRAAAGFRVSLTDSRLNTGAAAGDVLKNFEGLYLSSGHDTAFGSAVANTLYGRAGNDHLYGEAGNDKLFGEAGNDTLYGGLGADVLDGGAGFDYAAYDDADYSGFTVSLVRASINTGVARGDTFRGIEGLILSSGDDTAYGNDLANTVYGRDGGDKIYGLGGSDALYGESGDDFIYGGSATDRIYGGDGNDFASGEAAADFLYGDAGDDRVLGGDGDDVIFGGVGADTLSGDGGNDRLFGEGGQDALSGGAGNDMLDGGNDADAIDGGAGNDTLKSSSGNDVLTGGADADRFEFASGTGADRITDFEDDTDTIAISSSFGFASANDVIDNHTTTVGNTVIIQLSSGNGDSIELVDFLATKSLNDLRDDIIIF